ncbi:MAG TPA: beta-propeller fold lactonase family protein [Candidatus Baltobacteraceae bacterium]|nr:beta-propeller fold lactonase family protein [Candidatus Baltobacteraceae bacterium]
MVRRLLAPALAGLFGCAALAATTATVVLPGGWRLSPPAGPLAQTGTMPQGIALSPDGRTLAVVESGVSAPALRLLQTPGLREVRTIQLEGAFGKPVWLDDDRVLVAGANTDSLLTVDVRSGAVTSVSTGKDSWPAAVAAHAQRAASADDGDGAVSVDGKTLHVGDHPSDLVLSADGKTLYVSVRSSNSVAVVDVASLTQRAGIPVGLHPSALALSGDGTKLYVAESDDDAVGVIDTQTNAKIADISVRMHASRVSAYGASPNALAVYGNALFVSLGAQNAVALIRGDRVVERIPAGWYPTGVAVGADGTLYVSNGKGESAPANPQFNPLNRHSGGYVGELTIGSVRAVPASEYANAPAESSAVTADATPEWTPVPADRTILRAGGPIKHVFYVIKENRSYDQVLGDIPGADGERSLAMFGAAVTPNQHSLARRFGVFDNAYADAQVSADGHNWTDAAFANDYVERFWPPNYGNRRDTYDFQSGASPDVPHNGYLWDAALRGNVTFRDYGEDIDFPGHGVAIGINTFPGLRGHFDPRYIGWDLSYSDLARLAEWKREFTAYVAHRDLPQLEIVYLPNDHTSGTAPGQLTPRAYVATNDWAVGQLVDTVSHSAYWKSSAIFILEDDAQNGPDHVSDQRSTFYIASPYAIGGVQHTHYSTVSVVRTIELLLGLPPLSVYDQTTRPMYGAFAMHVVNAAAFDAVRPSINVDERNTRAAYGAAISAKLDFSRPDAVDPRVMNDILAHLRP